MDTTPVNIRVSADQPPEYRAKTADENINFNHYLINVNKQQEDTIHELTEALADKDRQRDELETTCDSLESKNGLIRNFLKTQYHINEANIQLQPTLASFLARTETTTFYSAIGMGAIIFFCFALAIFQDTLSFFVIVGLGLILSLLVWAQCRLLQSSRNAFIAFQTVVKENKDVEHTNDMVQTLIDSQY